MFELTDLYHINLIWIILPSRCFLLKIFLRSSKRVFVFPGPLSSAWPPALAPNLYLPALAPNLYLTALAPNLYLPTLTLNFYLSPLVSPELGLAYTNLVPPICIYWPWPTIFITVLWFCIYLLIYSSSSGSSNISNSSNFLGLDNTHISTPILVN